MAINGVMSCDEWSSKYTESDPSEGERDEESYEEWMRSGWRCDEIICIIITNTIQSHRASQIWCIKTALPEICFVTSNESTIQSRCQLIEYAMCDNEI